MKKKLLLTLFGVAASVAASAITATDAFVSAPRSIFPLLGKESVRLDMVDYYNAGQSTPSRNGLAGGSYLTELTQQSATIRMSDASTVQLAVLPDGNLALITTVAAPARDSSIAFYAADWSKLADNKFFTAPTLSDWLADESQRDEVEMWLPFMMSSYSYDPATGKLTIVNNAVEFLSDDVYQTIALWLRETLVYEWSGGRFRKAK